MSKITVNKDVQNFANKFLSKQIIAFENFYKETITAFLANTKDHKAIRFGGGTALALYYFQHRISYDIDLFLNKREYLNYFSPRLWIDESEHFNQIEYIETPHHIGVVSKDDVAVDILSNTISDNIFLDDSHRIFSFNIYVEDWQDIIAKKIKYRIKDNYPRDLFDISYALDFDKNYLKNMLNRSIVTCEDIKKLKNNIENIDFDHFKKRIDEISFDPMTISQALDVLDRIIENITIVSTISDQDEAKTTKLKNVRERIIDHDMSR